jgi:putative hydrolase of the HAD superfamily
MIPIHAVVFDFGKVLCRPQSPETVDALAARLGAPRDAFLAAFAEFRLEFDRGALDDAAYWTAVAGRLGVTISPETIAALSDLDARGWSVENEPVTRWAREVRAAGKKTAILSNMQTSFRRRLPELCDWLPTFDHATFSSDISLVKPEPGIYEHCRAALGVAPERLLFIDDVPGNIAAARALGWQGIVFDGNLVELARAVAAYDVPPLVL